MNKIIELIRLQVPFIIGINDCFGSKDIWLAYLWKHKYVVRFPIWYREGSFLFYELTDEEKFYVKALAMSGELTSTLYEYKDDCNHTVSGYILEHRDLPFKDAYHQRRKKKANDNDLHPHHPAA